eukprot:TRINITY_DN24670_c0_g1_i3.p1 TRINITY_DN24670_c0_g1~~TRINITY_DN24670_c0_g1_i3.p1  ORF type:complete len:308 (-),score=25.26 TRINITY_DN24670_c0_g1_i3:893-1816(-)
MRETAHMILVVAIALVGVIVLADVCLEWRVVMAAVKSAARLPRDAWRASRTCHRGMAAQEVHCGRSQRRLELLRVCMLDQSQMWAGRLLRLRVILPPFVLALAALRASGSEPEAGAFDLRSSSPMWGLSLLYMLCFVAAHCGLLACRGGVTIFTMGAQICFAAPFLVFGDAGTVGFAALSLPLAILVADPVIAGIEATLVLSVMICIFPEGRIAVWFTGALCITVGAALFRHQIYVIAVAKMESEQSQRLRRSMDCFLTTSYDALVQLDPELRIMEDSMRFSNLVLKCACSFITAWMKASRMGCLTG